MSEVERRSTAADSLLQLKILVVCLLVLAISVELLTRAMHDRRKVTLAIERGLGQALLIRPGSTQRTLLFAGNSLVFEDLSQATLQRTLGSGYTVYVAGVPGSTYFDWRYGLRSLYARGSEPDLLVFAISPSQFLRSASVTPLPVARLWRTREVFDYVREAHPGLTTLSELLLERYTVFFAMRDTIRIYSRKAIPGFKAMVDGWGTSGPAPSQTMGSAELVFTEKLSALQQECASHSRLLLMIAPTNQAIDQRLEPALRSVAARLGIAVVAPVGEMEWPASAFEKDGYHLSEQAAETFSALVASDLKHKLEEPAMRTSTE